MEYRRFGEKIVIRINKGEEIISELKKVCEKENVQLASITAIGALDKLSIGIRDSRQKIYVNHEFSGEYELIALIGNVTVMDGNFYAHLHMSAADLQGDVIGGHLHEARVSATCEIFMSVCDGKVERAFDEETGLNLMSF